MPPSPRLDPPPLSLAEMVDLQALLERDADEDEQVLLERDGALGRDLNASALPDVLAMRAWLAERQLGHPPSAGARLVRWGARSAWLIRAGAAVAGLATVGGWLQAQGRQPLNVINFWAALLGTQILFLFVFAYSIARWRWQARRPQPAPDGSAEALPWLASLIDGWRARAARSGEARGLPGPAWTKVRKLYGEVMGWEALRWAQLLAVFYNVGAIAGLVLWSTVSDPSFGWRSTLLDDNDVHSWADGISAPWAWLHPSARPSYADVLGTRYSSLDARFMGNEGLRNRAPVWAAWWPFLLMSLLTYGLLPRLVTYAWTAWRSRKAVAAAPWRSAAAEQVLHRMRRTGLTAPAPHTSAAGPVGPVVNRVPHDERPDTRPACVMKWANVTFAGEADALEAVHFTVGRQVRPPLAVVGGKNLDADDHAIKQAADASGAPGVAVLVPGWDPPVGDHVDFFEQLRRALGPKRAVDVVVCGLGEGAASSPPTESQMRLWRHRLIGLGDPWLRVHALREQGPA